MITYYAFLSLFPLLLLLTSVLGFAAAQRPGAAGPGAGLRGEPGAGARPAAGRQRALAARQHGRRRGRPARRPVREPGRRPGRAERVQQGVGGAAGAPAEPVHRPAAQPARCCVVLGIGLVVSTGLSALSSVADQVGSSEIGSGLRILFALAAVVLNVVVADVRVPVADGAPVGTRGLLPGATARPRCCGRSCSPAARTTSATRCGTPASRTGCSASCWGCWPGSTSPRCAVVIGAELNSVLARRLWPRSLLTPFTDDVQLTRGDRKAYASYAQTEQHKGFETVDVGLRPAGAGREEPGQDPKDR